VNSKQRMRGHPARPESAPKICRTISTPIFAGTNDDDVLATIHTDFGLRVLSLDWDADISPERTGVFTSGLV
jgi:hypothetical protein